jgi:hypothetical protein
LNNIELNFDKIIDLAMQKEEEEKKHYLNNDYLLTEKEIVKIDESEINPKFQVGSTEKDVNYYLPFYEKVFTENEKKYLDRMFLTYSSDNVS